jgi:ADP-heptose:LPS heptosyltransferase
LDSDARPTLRLSDWKHHLTDFAETAALMMQLDLVISVDTATAHLAGALGRPLWVLLPNPPDWRWTLDGPQSPWYPAARLFRQNDTGDWADVIKRVAAELTALTCAR